MSRGVVVPAAAILETAIRPARTFLRRFFAAAQRRTFGDPRQVKTHWRSAFFLVLVRLRLFLLAGASDLALCHLFLAAAACERFSIEIDRAIVSLRPKAV